MGASMTRPFGPTIQLAGASVRVLKSVPAAMRPVTLPSLGRLWRERGRRRDANRRATRPDPALTRARRRRHPGEVRGKHQRRQK